MFYTWIRFGDNYKMLIQSAFRGFQVAYIPVLYGTRNITGLNEDALIPWPQEFDIAMNYAVQYWPGNRCVVGDLSLRQTVGKLATSRSVVAMLLETEYGKQIVTVLAWLPWSWRVSQSIEAGSLSSSCWIARNTGLLTVTGLRVLKHWTTAGNWIYAPSRTCVPL